MAAKRTGPKCRTINGVVYDLTATDRKPPCGRGRPAAPKPAARASKPPAAPKRPSSAPPAARVSKPPPASKRASSAPPPASEHEYEWGERYADGSGRGPGGRLVRDSERAPGFGSAPSKRTTLAAAGKIEPPRKAAELGGTERMILQYVKNENQAGKLYVPRDRSGAVAAVLADLVKRGLVTERPGGRYLLPEFDGKAQFKLAPEPDLYAHLPKETGAAKLRRKQINAVSKLIERSPTALTQGAIVDATGLPVRVVADAIIALTGDKSIKLASPDPHGFPRYEWAHWRRTGVVKLAPLPAPIEPKSASIGQHVSVFSYGEGQPEHATLIELPASKDPVVKFDTGSQRGFQRSIQWKRIYPGWLERHGNWKPWRG